MAASGGCVGPPQYSPRVLTAGASVVVVVAATACEFLLDQLVEFAKAFRGETKKNS